MRSVCVCCAFRVGLVARLSFCHVVCGKTILDHGGHLGRGAEKSAADGLIGGMR